MNIAHTHHPHEHHHLIPAAIAGSAAVIAAALLTGPVQLSFGGDDDPPGRDRCRTSRSERLRSTGRCTSSGHAAPGDVPAPACRVGGVDTTIIARAAQSAAPVPCFRQFRVWVEDEARPLGCD